jgi:hypothetical protein
LRSGGIFAFRRFLPFHSVRQAAAFLLIVASFVVLGRRVAADSTRYAGGFSFKVLDPDSGDVIGHSRYESVRGRDDFLIGRGQVHFKNGEYDLEYDILKLRQGNAPAMLTLDHKFYNADGSMQREVAADFRTGLASCTRYHNGVAQTDSAKLDFTQDSYGGSAIVLPLEQHLARRSSEPLRLQALNCVPKPRLIAVQARVRQPARWSHYPRQTVEVDITPDLGWLSAVLSPFLPQLRAWFDPSDSWTLAGGEFSRYFRGPRIMIVREISAELRNAENRKEAGGD